MYKEQGKNNDKQIRHFSEDFKKLKVKELELKQITVAKLVCLYDVSRSTVYKWIYKYSIHHQKATRLVVELESESQKTERLQKRVAELERIVGQKQLEIDLLNKLIEISSEELGVDLKKNISTKHLNGSDATKINIPGE
jgi:transposase-like protein